MLLRHKHCSDHVELDYRGIRWKRLSHSNAKNTRGTNSLGHCEELSKAAGQQASIDQAEHFNQLAVCSRLYFDVVSELRDTRHVLQIRQPTLRTGCTAPIKPALHYNAPKFRFLNLFKWRKTQGRAALQSLSWDGWPVDPVSTSHHDEY